MPLCRVCEAVTMSHDALCSRLCREEYFGETREDFADEPPPRGDDGDDMGIELDEAAL